VPKKAAAVSEYSRKCEYGLSVLVSFHPPTQAPQIRWFSSDTARCINLLTYLLIY